LRGKIICPVCGKKLNFRIISRIDFVGEGIILFAFSCKNCGYSGFDIFPEKIHEPRIIEFKVKEKKDLDVLIARSSTATIKIPEIGAEIKPGPSAQGFITTVEGVLLRFKEVFKGNPKAVKLIDELLEGKPFTLIIDDPFGTSAVDSTEANIIVKKRKSFKTP